MRIYLILSILVLIICEAQSQTPQFDQLFHEFISKYNRMYFTENEKEARFQIFKSNYLKIYQHNEVQKDWRMEINRFTDMRDEEQKRMFHNLEINLDEISINNTEYNENENENIYNNKILKIDWTSKCGRIQDQMDCGSCYAFSAVESLQFAHFQQTTNFEYFSQQQIVDCSQDYGNDGCYGGLMENVFKYTAHKGILTAREYPYHAIKDRCRKEGGWKNYGYQNAPRNNDNLLAAALMERPISVAVDADTWTYYAGGIMMSKNACGTELDHGVFLVGADIEGPTSYWKIKNSWGSDWGENGYIRVERNTKGGTGPCGISLHPSYALHY